jgi:hypothetical protein
MGIRRDILGLMLIGSGLAFETASSADVVLLSQQRTVTATATSVRTGSASDFSDWSSNKLFYQSGSAGYWNGAAQYSSFQPDGATAMGQSVYAEGSTRSELAGSSGPSRTSTWTASSLFEFVFRVDSAQFINIFISADWTGSGSVQASLESTSGGSPIWQLAGPGNENVIQQLAVGTYRFRLAANSSLDTAGLGGDSLFNLGIGFTPVPGPSALCMVAVSAFLRRRRH